MKDSTKDQISSGIVILASAALSFYLTNRILSKLVNIAEEDGKLSVINKNSELADEVSKWTTKCLRIENDILTYCGESVRDKEMSSNKFSMILLTLIEYKNNQEFIRSSVLEGDITTIEEIQERYSKVISEYNILYEGLKNK